ncbi:MAG: hypothetical protein HZB56_03990 [Deltaproteobacteria bacterium]|nr:hypothetical protein [Deltaproteobacteria bacterium]
MRCLPVVMLLLLSSPGAAQAQISIQIGLPSVRIGFDQVSYPQLVAVPGYPVYYDPGSPSNYFFYDGLYWVYEGDTWYASSWFNGPWDMVEPQWVPLFVLRVPVRYYRRPPVYFGGWRADEPPRWGEHWGHDWSRQRRGWDRWDRAAAPAPAPLPVYQRQYAGDRYPRPEQQHTLRAQNYTHEPRDEAVTRVYRAQVQRAAQPAARSPQPQPRAQPERPRGPERQPQAQPERPQVREARPQPQPERRQAREQDKDKDKDKDKRGKEGSQQEPGRGGGRGRERGD